MKLNDLKRGCYYVYNFSIGKIYFKYDQYIFDYLKPRYKILCFIRISFCKILLKPNVTKDCYIDIDVDYYSQPIFPISKKTFYRVIRKYNSSPL